MPSERLSNQLHKHSWALKRNYYRMLDDQVAVDIYFPDSDELITVTGASADEVDANVEKAMTSVMSEYDQAWHDAYHEHG